MAKKKEADFFELMIAEAKYTTELTVRFKELFDNYDKKADSEDLQVKLDEIHAIEHQGDIAHAEIVTELNRAFITPIDREDIFTVAENIDKMTNAVENVAFRLWMFDIKELRADIHEFTDLIVKSVSKANEIIAEFKNYKKSKTLSELIRQVNEYENDGDRIYRNAVRNLFATEKDPIETQKWREFYHDMEKCFDACSDLAGSVERAAVKNS